MYTEIGNLLIQTGILQFGRFYVDNKVKPIRFCPEYLPAHPHLLSTIAKVLLSTIETRHVTHLIVSPASVALGVACSIDSGKSLIYGDGNSQGFLYHLYGAFNSGAKAVLLVNSSEEAINLESFTSQARDAGIAVQAIAGLIKMRPAIQHHSALRQDYVLDLAELATHITAEGSLPCGQKEAILGWQEKHCS